MNLADRAIANVITELHQEPTWSGIKTACTVVGGTLKPDASGADTVDADYRYIFVPDEVQLGHRIGALTTRTHSGRFQTRLEYRTDSQENCFPADGSALAFDVDGDLDVDAADGAALAWPALGEFQPFPKYIIPTERISYRIKLRLLAWVGGAAADPRVQTHTLYSDVPDLRYDVSDFLVSEAGSRLPVGDYFVSIKSVTVTLQGLIEGDYRIVQIVDKNAVGPLIRVMDYNGNGVSALVDAHVVGVPSQAAFGAGLVVEPS